MSPLYYLAELVRLKTYFERFLIKSFESQKVAVAAGLVKLKFHQQCMMESCAHPKLLKHQSSSKA